MTHTPVLAAFVALPAFVLSASAADLSSPEGVYEEQLALMGEMGDILSSTRTPEEMAAAINALVPRARALQEAVKHVDKISMDALLVTHKEQLRQVLAKLMPGIMKISMDPAYAGNAALQQAMQNFTEASGGEGASF